MHLTSGSIKEIAYQQLIAITSLSVADAHIFMDCRCVQKTYQITHKVRYI
jgi:hypothetical protein